MKYSTIDLFAGAGGLSQGFLQTDRFDIKVAFEKNKNAQRTYLRNHPNVDMRDDVIGTDYSELAREHGSIDVVIGGPPCQGFSNANRQHTQAISLNNKLVKEYVRAILALQPKAFVMENVSMLKSSVHRFYMEQEDASVVGKYHVPYQDDVITLLPSDVVFPGAQELAQDYQAAIASKMDKQKYQALNIVYRQLTNRPKMLAAFKKHKSLLTSVSRDLMATDTGCNALTQRYHALGAGILMYYETERFTESFDEDISIVVMAQRMCQRMGEVIENHIINDGIENKDGTGIIIRVKSCAVFDYVKCILTAGDDGYMLTKGVMNAASFGVPQKRMRFIIIGLRKGLSQKQISMPDPQLNPSQYRTVRNAIEDIEDVEVSYSTDAAPQRIEPIDCPKDSLVQELRNSDILYNHMTTSTTEIALERFKALKEGQNFHNLSDELKATYTNAQRTQNTIYMRLQYDKPAGTVVNVRKSMWIHPKLNRALTVREAARLQSFPDSFVFVGTKDAQFQQVGNAVPPLLAEAIAKEIITMLDAAMGNNNE